MVERLGLKQAARLSGVSVWIIRRAVTRGGLPASFDGAYRIERGDLLAWAEARQARQRPERRRLVTVRVTDEEHAAWTQEAAADGISVAERIRRRMNGGGESPTC